MSKTKRVDVDWRKRDDDDLILLSLLLTWKTLRCRLNLAKGSIIPWIWSTDLKRSHIYTSIYTILATWMNEWMMSNQDIVTLLCTLSWMRLSDLDDKVRVALSACCSPRRFRRLHQQHPDGAPAAPTPSSLPSNSEAKRAADQTLVGAASCWWKRAKKRRKKGATGRPSLISSLLLGVCFTVW